MVLERILHAPRVCVVWERVASAACGIRRVGSSELSLTQLHIDSTSKGPVIMANIHLNAHGVQLCQCYGRSNNFLHFLPPAIDDRTAPELILASPFRLRHFGSNSSADFAILRDCCEVHQSRSSCCRLAASSSNMTQTAKLMAVITASLAIAECLFCFPLINGAWRRNG